jgi:hypothetical protein
VIDDPDMTFGDYFENKEGWTVTEWVIMLDGTDWMIFKEYKGSGSYEKVIPSEKPVAGQTYCVHENFPV